MNLPSSHRERPTGHAFDQEPDVGLVAGELQEVGLGQVAGQLLGDDLRVLGADPDDELDRPQPRMVPSRSSTHALLMAGSAKMQLATRYLMYVSLNS